MPREWTPADEREDRGFRHFVGHYAGPLSSTAHTQRTWTDLCRLLLALGIAQATDRKLRPVPDHEAPRGRDRPVTKRRPLLGDG